jgi:large subunit ribosomal protein L29
LKTAEIRELPSEELQTRLGEVKEELFNLRFQHATGQLENYSRLGQLRRDVARLRSIQRERELGIGNEPQPEEVERRRKKTTPMPPGAGGACAVGAARKRKPARRTRQPRRLRELRKRWRKNSERCRGPLGPGSGAGTG